MNSVVQPDGDQAWRRDGSPSSVIPITFVVIVEWSMLTARVRKTVSVKTRDFRRSTKPLEHSAGAACTGLRLEERREALDLGLDAR